MLLERGWIYTKPGLCSPVDLYVFWPFQGGKHSISSCNCPSLPCFMSSVLLQILVVPYVRFCFVNYSYVILYLEHMMIYMEWLTMLTEDSMPTCIWLTTWNCSMFNHPPTIPQTVKLFQIYFSRRHTCLVHHFFTVFFRNVSKFHTSMYSVCESRVHSFPLLLLSQLSPCALWRPHNVFLINSVIISYFRCVCG